MSVSQGRGVFEDVLVNGKSIIEASLPKSTSQETSSSLDDFCGVYIHALDSETKKDRDEAARSAILFVNYKLGRRSIIPGGLLSVLACGDRFKELVTVCQP
jgi:hypothetical protein